MNFNGVFFFPFRVLTLTSQISRTRTGWSGSLIQKMKSLRSFPCEEQRQCFTVLDSWARDSRSLLCIRREA